MKSIKKSVVVACLVVLLGTTSLRMQEEAHAGGIPVLDVASLIQNTLIAGNTLKELGFSADTVAHLFEQIQQIYDLQVLQQLTIDAVTSELIIIPELQEYFDSNSSEYFRRTMPGTFVLFVEAVINGDVHTIIAILNRLTVRYPRAERFDPFYEESWVQTTTEDLRNYTIVSEMVQEQTYSELSAALEYSQQLLLSPAPTNATKLDKIALQLDHLAKLRVKSLAAGAAAGRLDAQWMRRMVEEQKQFVLDAALMLEVE